MGGVQEVPGGVEGARWLLGAQAGDGSWAKTEDRRGPDHEDGSGLGSPVEVLTEHDQREQIQTGFAEK